MKDTVRHLHRKLQHNAAGLPPDLLQPTGVDIKYAGHVGFPELADSLAFEPVQSLLAVGTQDGRVKLIGRPGVEVSLRSSSRSPTKYLGFLKNRGAVLRVTQEGDIQLFSIVERRLSASTWLQGDTIAAVALLPNDPYILLGCESGCVRVVALLDGASRPAEGAAPAVGLTLQPYQVLAHDLDAKGPVVALDVTRFRGRPLLLVVHKNSGALVWDVRAEKIMCAALDDENEISKPTSSCWVGERANCFAVGYDDGSILLYGVPPAALQEDPFKVSAPGDARLLMTFRVANLGTRAAPIKSLTFVAGEKGDDWLMVLGGQAADEPDMLTKLPLVAHASGKTMPWFGTIKGFALVPCKGSLTANDDPAAVMVLTEGGQLVVHDLRSWQPMPLTLPFQELPPISVARFVPTVSLSLLGLVADALESAQPSPVMPSPGSSHSGRDGHRASRTSERSTPSAPPVQHALTLDKLVRVGGRRGVGASLSGGIPTSAAAAAAAADAWPLHGGEPAQRWGAGPGSVPSAPGAAATAAAAGTAAAAAAAATAAAALAGRHPSALYFTGHRDGRVRVWDATTQVPTLLMTMPASGGPAAQERLRPVTALEVCPFSGIVLVGHQAGEVRLYQFTDSQQTVHRMNVDETGVPYDNVGAQPPGFQYVMRYSTHAADITGACLATKLKLAAVADESGTISVLDLMQPGLLWSTKALQRPIRHLAVGCHVIPGPEKKGEKGSGGAAGEPASGGETERLVLFAAGDDSTLLMLSLEKGEILEKPLRPKNASRTLAMELLDYNGTPVPPPRGVMTFPWANNNTPVPLTAHDLMAAAEAADASMRQLSLSTEVPLPNFSPRLPGSSSGVLGTSNGHSVGGVQRQVSVGVDSTGKPMGAMRGLSIDQPAAESSIADSLELRELPSDDEVDSAQVAAAAAVVAPETDARQQQPEQQQKGAVKPKFRLPKGFLRAGMKRLSSAADPTDLPSPTTPGSSAAVAARQGEGGSKPTSPTSSAPVSPQQSLDLEPLASGGAGDAAAGAAFSGLNRVTPTETVGSATLSGSFSPQHSVPRSLPSTKVAHIGDLVDYPYLIDAEPTPAAYVLLCTEDYVRVYSTENVRLGDRTTERKASEDPPLVAAGIFMSVHGPGVVTVSSDGALAVRTVPGLDCIYRLRLDHASVLGFKWSFGPDASVAAATSACSLDGQLMLAGPSNEIARVLVVQDCVEPTGPGSTYDAALAEAASAALAAQAAALAAQRSFSKEVYVVPEASAAEAAAVGAAAGDMSKRGLGRFFNTVKGTATGVLDTASKTAATVVQGTMTELDRGMRLLGGGEGDQQRRELPSLPTLFSTPVEAVETENDDIDYMTDEEEPALSPTSSGGMSSRAGLSTASSAALSPRSAAAAASAASAGAEPSPRPSTAASAAASAAAAAGAKATAGLAAVGAALRRAGSTSTKERQQEGKNQTKDRQQEGRKSERGELMQGATTTAARPEFKSGATHMRTTSSIREAYGRPRHTERSQQVKGIMEENRRRLQERGEKLANLEQRTAQMQDDASDFASLAKQLESSFANRKWWQV